jgi:hypothetical protein
MIVAVVVASAGCGTGPQAPTEKQLDCQPLIIHSTDYFSFWQVNGSRKQAATAISTKLVPSDRKAQPTVSVLSHWAQAKPSGLTVGIRWLGSKIGISVPAGAEPWAEVVGLRPVKGTVIRPNRLVTFGFVIRGERLGVTTYKGMDLMYAGHGVTKTLFLPNLLAVKVTMSRNGICHNYFR